MSRTLAESPPRFRRRFASSNGTNNIFEDKFNSGTIIPNRVFIGGLHQSVTEADLEEKFKSYGKVAEIKIIKKPDMEKGYGFVTFEYQDDASKLLQQTGTRVKIRGFDSKIGPAIRRTSTNDSSPMEAESSHGAAAMVLKPTRERINSAPVESESRNPPIPIPMPMTQSQVQAMSTYGLLPSLPLQHTNPFMNLQATPLVYGDTGVDLLQGLLNYQYMQNQINNMTKLAAIQQHCLAQQMSQSMTQVHLQSMPQCAPTPNIPQRQVTQQKPQGVIDTSTPKNAHFAFPVSASAPVSDDSPQVFATPTHQIYPRPGPEVAHNSSFQFNIDTISSPEFEASPTS